eukprot:Pgem_evm1s10979
MKSDSNLATPNTKETINNTTVINIDEQYSDSVIKKNVIEEKNDNDDNDSYNDDDDDDDDDVNKPLVTKSKFRQNGRCCWGGLSKPVFIILIIIISLIILAAILVPVIYIPLTGSLVQGTLDDLDLVVTKIDIRAFNPMNKYVMMNQTVELRHVHSIAKGVISLPTNVDLIFEDEVFGKIILPQMTLSTPTTVHSEMISLFITNTVVMIQAMLCSSFDKDCKWGLRGFGAAKKQMAAT